MFDTLRHFQMEFQSQQKTHQRYAHQVLQSCFSVPGGESLHVIFLGENSHWKVGVWGEQSAGPFYLLCFLLL